MAEKITVKDGKLIVPEKPYIVISNHESTVDVFYLLGELPIPMRMVAKEELRKTPFLGSAMKRTGFIFVDIKFSLITAGID